MALRRRRRARTDVDDHDVRTERHRDYRVVEREVTRAYYESAYEHIYPFTMWRYTIRGHFADTLNMRREPYYDANGNLAYKNIVQFCGGILDGFDTIGDAHRYLMFWIPRATALERFEREVFSVSKHDYQAYRTSDKWKAHTEEVFGKPKVLRYYHSCTDCMPVIKYRQYDVYFCPGHNDGYLHHRSSMAVVVVRSSPSPLHRQMYSFDMSIVQRRLFSRFDREERESDGVSMKGSDRAMRLAHMAIWNNLDSYPYIKEHWASTIDGINHRLSQYIADHTEGTITLDDLLRTRNQAFANTERPIDLNTGEDAVGNDERG